MAKIEINFERCKGCELCVAACPRKIVAIGAKSNNKGYFVATCTDNSQCTGCAACANMCPETAIEVER